MLNPVTRPDIPTCAWQRPIGQGWNNPYRATDANTIDDGPWQGMPLGGFGAGNIGRSPRGEFNLWQLDGGEHLFRTLSACQFSIFEQPENGPAQAYALCTAKPEDGSLSGWAWYPSQQGTYAALYPRSWFNYQGVFANEIICEQFSPIWPGNYQACSYPLACFDWYLHNPTNQSITISILFTWQNTLGWFAHARRGGLRSAHDYLPRWGDSTGNYNQWILDHYRVGFLFDRVQPHEQLQEGEGQMAIASIANPSLEVFYLGRWNPQGDGSDIWDHFAADGSLPDKEDETPAGPGEQVASAMAVRVTIRPGRSRQIPFILTWDLPLTEFAPGVQYYRRYTDFFGRSGTNAWSMVRTALKHRDMWKERIQQWQQPILHRPDVPDTFKMALCNELSILATGGTLWTAATETDPVGQFGSLESLAHRCYESMDVRLYSSFGLALLWPRLDQAILDAFARAIVIQDNTPWLQDESGTLPRKAKGATPHDLGAPYEHPWQVPNATTETGQIWRLDFSSAFILQVYRRFQFSGGKEVDFLWECWPAIAATLSYWQSFPSNNLGLPSAPLAKPPLLNRAQQQKFNIYQAGLWIAALEAAIAIGQQLLTRPPLNPQLRPKDYPAALTQAITDYQTWLTMARKAEPWTLPQDLPPWTHVTSAQALDEMSKDKEAPLHRSQPQSPTEPIEGEFATMVGQSLAEQLCGSFYAQILGLPAVSIPDPTTWGLNTLNVTDHLPLPSLPTPNPKPVTHPTEQATDIHSHAIQTISIGHNWGLAANLAQMGRETEALLLAEGLIQAIYDHGLQFRTPKVITTDHTFQASHGLSAMSIWCLYGVFHGFHSQP